MQVTIREHSSENSYLFEEMIGRRGFYECVNTGIMFFVTVDRNCFQVLSNNLRYIPYEMKNSPEFSDLRLVQKKNIEIVLRFYE